MALARFLQVSDLHLGRPFGWLPNDRQDERRREQRRVLERAVSVAIERGVDAILCPGDLFDAEGVDTDTLRSAVAVFEVQGCPPVFISPGNHDPASDSSLYWNPRLLAGRGIAWPANVHVFTTPEWSSRSLPNLEGVRVWGRCFTANIPSFERPLAPDALREVSGADANGFHVAVFHGSREGQCPPGQKVTAPFSDDEALQSPFAYLAVGHYHASSRLTGNQGAANGVRLAYAGSAAALDPTEIGVHGALEVRVEYDRHQPFVETEMVELDRRHVIEAAADVTGCASAEQVDRRIQQAIERAGASEHDLVTVRLSGRLAHGVRMAQASSEVQARVWNLKLDWRRVRPDYDVAAYRAKEASTTEERFARNLLDQIERESDPAQRALIESALFYGLDAFRLGEVVPAYEELESTEEPR
jgi:DNA repair exonuclease SbcCD nuclease subunit